MGISRAAITMWADAQGRTGEGSGGRGEEAAALNQEGPSPGWGK